MSDKKLAHYTIVEKIGEGGMGVVYRASDSKLGRDVALKVLPEAFVKDPERLARFKREAQLLASLNHPHIASIYGLEEVEGGQALVLELVQGPTLENRIAEGAMPLDEALRIAHQIAEALESAHERGIIHRDLKPANIKLTVDGRVKVLDFGLAKALEADAGSSVATMPTQSPTITGHLTGANVILGTAAYMSPEQARGQTADKRADIWAFGVILFEMLSGRRLFSGETVSDTLASVLKVDPDWGWLPESVPQSIRRLITRCLRRDPALRLRDIGDARIVIDDHLSGVVQDEVPAEAATPAAPSRRWLAALIGAVLGAVAVGAVGWTMKSSTPEAPLRKFELSLDDAVVSLGSGTTQAVSPDGTKLAYVSGGKLWVRDMNRLEAREAPKSGEAVSPFWSPDGEWVGFFTTGRLWKWPDGGGEPTLLCEVKESTSPAAGGAWMPDGKIIFCSGDGPIYEVLSQGGDPQVYVAPDSTEDDFHNVAPLPDGRGILFVVHRRQEGYDCIDAYADGVRKRVVQMDDQSLSYPAYAPSGHVLFSREPANRGVWAVPFSLSDLQATGEPFLAYPDAGVASVGGEGTLAYVKGGNARLTELVWVSRSGQVQGAFGDRQQMYPSPRLSPDGRKVAIRAAEGDDRDIWIHDTVRNTKTRLTFETGLQDYPSWSPDGQWVFYQQGSGTGISIWVRKGDGTGEPRRLVDGGYFSVSQKGDYLLYSKYNGTDWEIWSAALGPNATLEGDSTLFVNAGKANPFWPQLSPNGRYLSYTSDESGHDEIYVKRFPGGDGKWQVSVDGGEWSRWGADGNELYYADGKSLIMVPVEYEPSFSMGAPEALFVPPRSGVQRIFGWPDGFDVTADGQKFVFVRRAQDDDEPEVQPGIVVVQNWNREFEKAE